MYYSDVGYQVYLGITSPKDVVMALVLDIPSTSEKYFGGPEFWPPRKRGSISHQTKG